MHCNQAPPPKTSPVNATSEENNPPVDLEEDTFLAEDFFFQPQIAQDDNADHQEYNLENQIQEVQNDINP